MVKMVVVGRGGLGKGRVGISWCWVGKGLALGGVGFDLLVLPWVWSGVELIMGVSGFDGLVVGPTGMDIQGCLAV